MGKKTFIPARPKIDPNESNRFFSEFALIAVFLRTAMSSSLLTSFNRHTICTLWRTILIGTLSIFTRMRVFRAHH